MLWDPDFHRAMWRQNGAKFRRQTAKFEFSLTSALTSAFLNFKLQICNFNLSFHFILQTTSLPLPTQSPKPTLYYVKDQRSKTKMDLPTLLYEMARGGAPTRRTPALEIADKGDARVFEHQMRDIAVAEGPLRLDRFRAQKWTFRVVGNVSLRLTFHHYDPASQKKRVMDEIEYFFRSALQQCLRDGAQPSDIVHIYLDCEGMDFRFFFNPTGQYAMTFEKLLAPGGLEALLERFAQMIQSGKDIFLDDKTRLIICAFTPPTGGDRRMLTSNKMEFLKNSTSIVRIDNPEDKTCFARCLALGMVHLKQDR